MPIYNEIFESYRQKQKEIDKAIAMLEKHGYIIYNKERKHETS
jgi:transcription initiation factor IIE alpha subunit